VALISISFRHIWQIVERAAIFLLEMPEYLPLAGSQ